MPATHIPHVLIIALAVLAGVLVSAQGMVNGRLNQVLESPIQAALISFTGGWLILLALSFILGHGLPSFEKLSAAPWWAFLGGVAGFYMVSSTAFGVPRVGSTAWLAAVIAGQMLASVAFDHIGAFGQEVRQITLSKLAGVDALVAGVWLIIRP